MTYHKQTWVDNDLAHPVSADRLNHLETQYDRALEDVGPIVTDSVNTAVADSDAIQDAVDQVVAGATDAPVAALIEDDDSATATVLNGAYAALPGPGRNALTGKFHVDGFGADMAGTADSTAAFQAAVTAAKAVGGTVYVPAGVISHRLIDVSNDNGLVIEYAGNKQAKSVPYGSATIDHLFGNTGAVKALTIRGMYVSGATVDDVTAPRRARTYSGTQLNAAVIINGDLVPGGGYPVARNVTIDQCNVTGTSSLPFLLRGIRGRARIERTTVELTMDVGWTFCERVECVDNTSIKSADNGFSMSRGNQSIYCAGNYVYMCAYSAFFAGGFAGDKGPDHIEIVGNHANNTGLAGIQLDEASKYAVVVGNVLDGGYNRGASDNPTNGGCAGIYFAGFPDTDRANPTDWAEGILVTGNTIRRYPRAGVLAVGVKRAMISGNIILDTGTQFMADGTTAIAVAEPTQNVGILLDNATTSSDVVIANNHIVDSRSTPYMNWAIYPVGSSVAAEYFNSMVGARNAYNLIETGPTRNINWGAIFQQNLKATAGGTAGSTAGTGLIAGWDTNGAAGSNRPIRWLTASLERWRAGADNTAEGGSNAGTDFVLSSYSDAGSALATLLRATRVGSLTLGVLGKPVTMTGQLTSGAGACSVAPGGQSATAAAAGNGANDNRGTINATAVASPAAGAIASVSFAAARATVPAVIVEPQNLASQQAGLYVSARGQTSFTVSCATAPASGATLQLDYIVVG